MDATTLSITLSAILAVICIPCGLFLGLVPMKADLVTAKQSKASQMVSFIVAIVFIGLLVAGLGHGNRSGHRLRRCQDPRTARLGFAQVAVLRTQENGSHPQARQESQEEVSSGLTYSLKAGYRHRYPAFSLAAHIR